MNLQIDLVWKQSHGYGGFFITIESPYKIFLNYAIIRMIEDGRLHHLNKIWIDKERKCSTKTEVPLGFEKTISIFFIVLGGIAIGLVIIVVEKYFGCMKLEKQRDPEKMPSKGNVNPRAIQISDQNKLCKCDIILQFLKSNQRRRSC